MLDDLNLKWEQRLSTILVALAGSALVFAWFHAWFRRWFALGVPAFVAVIAIYWLMVAKPLAVAGG